MIRFLFIISCFICVQKEEPVLSWNETYKLSWSDFKGTPNKNVSAVAVTASGITFGFSIRESDSRPINFSTEVHAHFYPEKSWYKAKLADHHVLGHEQLHYDITELHARKFRQQISLLKISNTIKNDLRQCHKDINKRLAKMQNDYDTETDFSRDVDFQAKWKRYIGKELQKLSKYKSVD